MKVSAERKGDRSPRGSSNSRPGVIYGTLRVGEAVEVEIGGEWLWAEIVLAEERWRTPRSPVVMTKKRSPVRLDDRVVLKVRKTGEIVRTTAWLMSRSAVYRGVQGALF